MDMVFDVESSLFHRVYGHTNLSRGNLQNNVPVYSGLILDIHYVSMSISRITLI